MGWCTDPAARFLRGGLLKMACKALFCAAGLSLTLPAMAVADSALFDIAAQPMPAALKTFATQAHMQLLYQYSAVASARGNAVNGDLEKHAALEQLLKNSGLEVIYSSDSVATIRPARSTTLSSAKGSPADGSAPSAQPAGDSLQLAQANPGQTSNPSAVDKPEQKSGESKGKEQPEGYQVNTPEVLIVGSRVMNVDVKRTEDDPQPYYILDSQQIEQSGAINVEDFLKQQLTMNTTFATSAQFYGTNGGTGTVGLANSNINLRGLGSNETLILIDGRRSANVNTINGTDQPDVNGIPLSAIERIEVLPSSASAIYGGAAVGGVVNIILKKNFNGGDVGYTYENTFDGSAPRRTVNGTYGFSLDDGKTRVMLSGQYSDGEPLLLGDRLNLVQRGISAILSNSPSYLYNPANPFPGPTPNIACQDVNGNPTNCVLRNGTPLNSPITHIAVGAAPGSNLAAGLLANAGTYNLNLAPGTGEYGLQNQFGTATTNKSFMATVRQEFTANLESFAEFSTFSNAGRGLYNPFFDYNVPASTSTNPFQQTVLIDIPNRLSVPATSDSVTQSATVGLIAHLAGDWRSELDYTWSRNSTEWMAVSSDSNAFGSALAAGTINPFVDTLDYPLNLAPYLGTVSESVRSTLNDLGLRVSGPIGSLPWGRPTLTIGLEHRKEGFDNDNYSYVYPSFPADDLDILLFGQSQSTDSVYAEALVPLVTAQNALTGIRSLDLQLALRSERYTVSAHSPSEYLPLAEYQAIEPPQGLNTTIQYTSTNPTVGFKYQPVEDLTLRASYSTAFLPPTAIQLMPNPQLQCGPSPCELITDPRNGETYNVNFTQGGNPNLQPQTSRDWDLGMIWEPKQIALQGLRLDLEYYKITQPNYITTPSYQQVVSDPALASRVTRDPTTGLITVVNISPLNATQYKTNGWDLTLDYRKPTPVGTFNLHALGTVIEQDLRQLGIGQQALNYVGYPADGGEAKVKANMRLSWEYKRWTLAWTTTYVGSYFQTGSPNSPIFLEFPGTNSNVAAAQGGFTIPSQIYHEVFGSYAFGKTSLGQTSGVARHLLSNLTLQFGIKNLFNTQPPFDAYNAPYYYSPYGDPRLRDYWLSIRKSF
jgi:iron complex outermembrane receptor protein